MDERLSKILNRKVAFVTRLTALFTPYLEITPQLPSTSHKNQ